MDLQTDLSQEALVTSIRANLCDFFRHIHRTMPEPADLNESFTRWTSPVAHPWFNGVISSLPLLERDQIFIEETIDYFDSRGVKDFTWWMDSSLPSRDGERLLSRYGFVYSDNTPGMAVDVQALNEPAQTAAGLEVRAVTDDESLRTWAHVFTIGYGLPPEWEPSIYQQQQQFGLDLPMRNFIGYVDNQPVATSCLFLGAGVAGVYSVSTLPEARGKGIGAAVTLQALFDARDLGVRVGTLQSSQMGYNIYKNLGFQHLCQIGHFYLAVHQ